MDGRLASVPSHRRQADDEARAEHLRCRRPRRGAPSAVLDPDRAAMRLDDLLGDRKAEAGILAEALMRPVGVEALEDLLERVGPHARPVVIDDDLDLVAQPPAGRRAPMPPGGENERAFSIRLSTTWPSRESWPGTLKARAPPPSNRSVTLTPSSRFTSLATATSGVEQLGQIDRRRLLALQFGVEAAGVGDIGDQAVEPFDVMLDDVEQPRAAFFGLGERQRLHRGAQRGQRVFQLVRNVGGKALDALRCGCRARWSCRAACRKDGRSRRAGG